jgi:hypothetical protein
MKKFNEFTNEQIKWYSGGNLEYKEDEFVKSDKEIIVAIEEIDDEIIPITKVVDRGKRKGETYTHERHLSGYRIETSKNEYKLLIDNQQDCCENWGYLSSDDDINSYLGSELLEISIVDESLKSTKIKMKSKHLSDDDVKGRGDMNAMFINLETSEGLLQFAVYNSHNGYYGHEVFYIINGNIEQEKML